MQLQKLLLKTIYALVNIRPSLVSYIHYGQLQLMLAEKASVM
jgi:hypothetical protein